VELSEEILLITQSGPSRTTFAKLIIAFRLLMIFQFLRKINLHGSSSIISETLGWAQEVDSATVL
jgi:hypothetical protein